MEVEVILVWVALTELLEATDTIPPVFLRVKLTIKGLKHLISKHLSAEFESGRGDYDLGADPHQPHHHQPQDSYEASYLSSPISDTYGSPQAPVSSSVENYSYDPYQYTPPSSSSMEHKQV